MNPRRHPDLNHERRDRHVEAHLREERADRIFLPGALEHLGRHVELLIDQHRAERPETDDCGNQLDLLRPAEKRERAPEADALLLVHRRRDAGGGLALSPKNH